MGVSSRKEITFFIQRTFHDCHQKKTIYAFPNHFLIKCLPCKIHTCYKQVHRGNLKEYIKNIENKKLSSKDGLNVKQQFNGSHNTTTQIIAKSLKSPKQEVGDADELSTIFKKFDTKYKTDSEKESSENIDDNCVGSGGGYDDDNNYEDDGAREQSPPSQDSPNTEDSSSSVPKPMPRTSRNNSLQDSTGQQQQPLVVEANKVMPKPRPRTTASAYKVCEFVVAAQIVSMFISFFL